jgi:hypothetical protein
MLQQKQNTAGVGIPEVAQATLLVMNLSPIAVGDVKKKEEKPGEKKSVTRANFMVLRVLSPGWTSVPISGVESNQRESKGKREPREKLNDMLGEHVVMHSYALARSAGKYTAGAKADECFVISPGMVFSVAVFGDSVLKVFKDQEADIGAFDVGIVHVASKSMGSEMRHTGLMLEIKGYTATPHLSASRLLRSELVPSSLVEAAILRSRFSDGTYLESTDMMIKKGELHQDFIKGNIAPTLNLVRFVPETAHGVFAIGPNDTVQFYVAQPLADVPCTVLPIILSEKEFGTDSKQWIVKQLNVCMLLGAVELFVFLDLFKKENTEGYALARIDASKIIAKLVTAEIKPMEELPVLQSVFAKEVAAVKHIGVFEGDVKVAVDTRRMTKKQTEGEVQSTLVHPNTGTWERGNSIYFFLEDKLVHCAVVPVIANVGGNCRQALTEVVALPSFADDCVDFEEEVVAPTKRAAASEAEPASNKKKPKKND